MNTSSEKCTFLDVIHLKDGNQAVLVTVVVVSIINSVTAVTAVVGNSVFLIVFAKVASIRSPSNALLVSLSVTDLLVGLVVQPTSVARRILEASDRHNCVLRVTYAFFGFLSSGASFLNIGVISLDRCLAICYPFWYEVSATKRTHAVLICIVWTIWAAFTVLPFAGVLTSQAFFIGVFAVLSANIVIVLVSYTFILRVIFAKKRDDAPLRVSNFGVNRSYCSNEMIETPEVCRRSENDLCPEPPASGIDRTQRSAAGRYSKNRAYTVTILVACMLVCYTPQLTVLLMRGAFGDDENLVFIADAWVDTITFINSSLNPIIYCYRLTNIRDAVMRTFRRRTRPDVVRNTQSRQANANAGVL